jgi:HEAT repeat protein
MLRSGVVTRRRETPANLETLSLASDGALSALADALGDPDPDVRAKATMLVAELSDKRAARLLKTMIHDLSPSVRVVAVSATGSKASMELVASLIVALGDPDPEVRRVAAEAISRATGQTVASSRMDPDDEQIKRLKQWWKEQRYAELARGAER